MDRISNQRTRRYGIARSQSPEHNLCEPETARELDWQPPDEERYRLVHEQAQPHTQRSSPSPSDTDTTVNASHEERASHNCVLKVSTSTKASTRWRRVRNANENYWLTEIGSCLVALNALVVIICVLRRYDGDLIPDWRYGITLNALVSILSSIFKAAAVLPLAGGISQAKWLWYAKSRPLRDMESFDEASRGPWGSLLLLVDFRSHYVASFGAFLTVFAMAIDPFTQQVVQTQSCLWKDNSTVARIPRTNIYNAFDVPSWYPTNITMDTAMIVAIYNGIISHPNNISAVITPICPSGNCTFPESDGKGYQSIAMCHQCDNITGMVQNMTISANATYLLPNGTKFNYTYPLLSHYLPSGAKVSNWQQGMLKGQCLSTTARNSTPIEKKSVFDIEMLMFTNRSEPYVGTSDWPDNTTQAHLLGARCSLFPCVKTYRANISRNIFQEHEVSRELIKYKDLMKFAMISDQVVRNGMIHNCSITLYPTDENNVYANNIYSSRYTTSDAWWIWTSEDCYWQVIHCRQIRVIGRGVPRL